MTEANEPGTTRPPAMLRELDLAELLSWLIGLQGKRVAIFTALPVDDSPSEMRLISSATGTLQGDFGRDLGTDWLVLGLGEPGYLASTFISGETFETFEGAIVREDGIVQILRSDGVVVGVDPDPDSRSLPRH